MIESCDIAILGGGPAGRAAAARIGGRAAARLLDEASPADPMQWGAPLAGHRVWGVGREGDRFRLDAIGASGPLAVLARSLVVCAGAHDGMPARWPCTEATRVLGAAHGFRPARGGWVPLLHAGQRTSVPGLFAAGDCAGLGGDAALEGAAAACAALADLGVDPGEVPMPPPPEVVPDEQDGSWRGLPAQTIICPCEGVTRGDVEAAILAGARDIDQLKSFTRAGMGPCQARLCAVGMAQVLGAHGGGREAAGLPTARLPLRPVPLGALLGAFDYADIPVPPAAPI